MEYDKGFCFWSPCRAKLAQESAGLDGGPGNALNPSICCCDVTTIRAKHGKPQSPIVADGEEQEELLMAEFNLDEIREFRRSESWRLACGYRGAGRDC
jgi:hypothetical protein